MSSIVGDMVNENVEIENKNSISNFDSVVRMESIAVSQNTELFVNSFHNETARKFDSGNESDQLKNNLKKKTSLSDSDSDDENFQVDVPVEEILKSKILIEQTNSIKKSFYFDSDMEDNSTLSFNINSSDLKLTDTKRKHKPLTIVDSDSEVEDQVVCGTHSFLNEVSNDQEVDIVYTTNLKGEVIPEKPDHLFGVENKWLALCDAESSDDEIVDRTKETNEVEEKCNSEEEVIKPKPYKKKRQSKSDIEQTKKMSGKDISALRKEIKSESQRMVRETNVSLPYHKPKSFTLKEFLSRRSKLASTVSVTAQTPPSVAIKMSTEQLEIISKKMKEREKEVKKFYKSESESEDEDDKDYDPSEDITNDRQLELNNEEEIINTNADPSKVDENINDKHEGDNEEPVSEKPYLAKQGENSENTVQCEDLVQDMELKVDNEQQIIKSNASNDDGKLVTNVQDVNSDSIDQIKEGHDLETSDSVVQHPIKNINSEEETNGETIEVIDDEQKTDENNFKNISDSKQTNEKDATIVKKTPVSIDYDFNLDDLEENTENFLHKQNEKTNDHKKHFKKSTQVLDEDRSKNLEQMKQILEAQKTEDNLSKQLIKEAKKNTSERFFQYDNLDKEIEEFGSATVDEIKRPSMSKLDLIKEKLANIQPKLSVGPNDVIDLETGITKPNEVSELMQRFVQHTAKKHVHKNKVKLNIVSIESGEVHKETVAMNVEDDDDLPELEEKPGAKLQKLRDELQNQMAQRRSELWQKKCTNKNDISRQEEKEEAEKSDYSAGDDILDDDEEEELTESSEEENVEDDVLDEVHHLKTKEKSVFINDEAEETDKDDEDGSIEADIEDQELQDSDSNLNEDEYFRSTVNEKYKVTTNKSLKRIIKRFSEDSDDEDVDLSSTNVLTTEKGIQNYDKITQDDDEDEIPPHQLCQTPIKNTTITQTKSGFEFFTPISYITGLQNLNNSATKPMKDSPFQIPNMPSPLKESNWQSSLEKKLFANSVVTESQIEDLCSGKIIESQIVEENSNIKQKDENQKLCSEKFSSIEDLENIAGSAPPSTQDLLNVCSGEFSGVSETFENSKNLTKNIVETHTFNQTNEIKSLGIDQDMIISQLLDEEEMEVFKKKFDSPFSNTQRRIVEEFEVAATGGIIDSDDDEILEVKKKRNKKKLTFSDDESSDEEEEQEKEEEIDLHDEDDDGEDIPADDIGYDSEENEIDLVKDGAHLNLKPSDFFDKEAELSESEWGSADEDEKDLDRLEFELGDTEKFDEQKMRTDIEKLHMRRMLDDDTKEVKLLQELLLEDGELHGTGRERQFKWRNIDSVDNEDGDKKEEDDIYLDEEESEEQWRKKRHEREMFLKENHNKINITDGDELLSDSQLLKIGHRVIQRSSSNSQGSTPTEISKSTVFEPSVKSSYSLLNKRGSFLSRGDQVLQRLAEYNKVTTAVAVGTAKNSRSFLFQTVAMEESLCVSEAKKRKASDGTPKILKKLRLTDHLSPANHKKKVDKPKSKAKLF